MLPAVRPSLVVASLLMATVPASADGLRLSASAQASWSTRLVVGAEPLHARQPVGSLLGERFLFDASPVGVSYRASGLRASSGLVLGAGSAALGLASALAPAGVSAPTRAWGPGGSPTNTDMPVTERWSASPYLGIGYSHHSLDGAWGMSADLGMVAAGLAWEFGRQSLGAPRLDEAVRNLRLRPVLQLGMHYRF